MNVDTFPLPSLSSKLTELSVDIHDGRGFSVIRGMDPRDYSVEDLTIAYMGVSSYIADKRGRQDKRGNILGKLPPPFPKTPRANASLARSKS